MDFRSMLKKKKYAAVTVTERPDGSLVYGTEYKGLDMVRRDWCKLSKNVGTFVLERVLDRDSVQNFYDEHAADDDQGVDQMGRVPGAQLNHQPDGEVGDAGVVKVGTAVGGFAGLWAR